MQVFAFFENRHVDQIAALDPDEHGDLAVAVGGLDIVRGAGRGQ